MELPHQMATLTRVLETLKEKNIEQEFCWSPQGFGVSGKNRYYQPHELEIIRVFRFEGITDPGDMSILYLIRSCDGEIGYSLNAYGTYSNHDDGGAYDNFIRQIPETGREEQVLFSI